MVADPSRPVLTLAELEAGDPLAPPGGRYRRFWCPLPACSDKSQTREHRTLAVEVATGGWNCWRCGAKGKLQEHWQTGVLRRQLANIRMKAKLRLPVAAPPPVSTDYAPILAVAVPLVGTPGEDYLTGRRIPLHVAEAAGVLFSRNFYGRPAVLFPVLDRQGATIAVNGRYIDSGTPKTRTTGPKSLGLFCTPGAFDGDVVITEAPIDALSLAAIGMPSVALVGTSGPSWLRIKVGFNQVALALDADEAGDHAAERIGAELTSFGSKVHRWRPTGAKDWNQLLQERGLRGLSEEVARVILRTRTSSLY